MKNQKDVTSKFDTKINEVTFLGYSLNSKTKRIYNNMTLKVKEIINVRFDETNESFHE